jgi:hypothetical protein
MERRAPVIAGWQESFRERGTIAGCDSELAKEPPYLRRRISDPPYPDELLTRRQSIFVSLQR